jgi:prepilin signal peptidase PulO-like enzyme (type II secretory pathway)
MSDCKRCLALCLAYLSALWVLAPPEHLRWIIALCLVVPLVWLSVVDLKRREIPDGAVMLVAIAGILVWWRDPFALLVNAAVAVGVVALLSVVGNWAWRKTGTEMLGLGDVKLIGAGILTVGAQAFWLMLLLASIGGIGAALTARASASEGIPFGPFLAYSTFITYLLSVHTV